MWHSSSTTTRRVAGIALCSAWLACMPAVAQDSGPARYSAPPNLQCPQTTLDFTEVFRRQELARLGVLREEMLARKHRWQPPAAAVGTGLGFVAVGAALLAVGNQTDNIAVAITGNVMVPIGAVTVFVITPLLILRALRSARLHSTERAIEGLGGRLSLRPVLSPARAGLSAHWRF
jgi:hypothetical protein